MFHDRVLNSRLNFIRKRALRLVCKGSETGHENLMNKTLTTHQHNLQLLMIEIWFKTKHGLNPTEVAFYGLHYQKKLNTPTLYLSSEGK